MSGSDSTEAEARAIIGRVKFMPPNDMFWEDKPTNSCFRISTFPLIDSDGLNIPGLTVELAYRIAPKFDDCKYHFSIYQFQAGGIRKRVYQLEVVPPDERSSHHDGKNFYGPHEHVGTLVREVRVQNLGCKDHEKWFREFMDRAKIGYGGLYNGPFDGGLFA